MIAVALLAVALLAAACVPPDQAPDSGVDAPDDTAVPAEPAACAPPTAGPTEHTGGLEDEVWTADAGPHLVPYDLSVHAQVTIEPCAVVEIAGGVTITVYPEGGFAAEGTEDGPVRVTGADAEPWSSIRSFGGPIRLVHARVEGGGDPQNGAPDAEAMIESVADVHVEHVTLAGSASQGLALDVGGRFTEDADDLVIEGSAGFPVRLHPAALGSVPAGAYVGNAVDEILVATNAVTDAIAADLTIRDRGVPYRIGDALDAAELRVGVSQGGPAAVLTIEPGVELRFAEGGLLSVEHNHDAEAASGALVAVGTADRPIVFTSAASAPVAGDWFGIWFGGIPDPRTEIAFARVAYAGRASATGSESCALDDTTNDAAIRIFGDPGVRRFVSDTAIAHSAAHGIDRGWSTVLPLDFLPSNTFDHVPGCLETWPTNPTAPCPVPPPCPTQ